MTTSVVRLLVRSLSRRPVLTTFALLLPGVVVIALVSVAIEAHLGADPRLFVLVVGSSLGVGLTWLLAKADAGDH